MDFLHPLYPNYARLPVEFVRGKGEFLFDANNQRYIDFLSGIAVASVGHCHPELASAIADQASKLMHVSNLYGAPWQQELAMELLRFSHLKPSSLQRVFFCNSGTEANEAALKLARAYGQKLSPKKLKVVSLTGSFHGRTMGSASMTGQKKGQELWGLLPEGFQWIEPENFSQLELTLNEDCCAFFFETVQGEGGVRPLSKEYLLKAQELCNKNDILMVCDEVQTGIWRSGSFWAHQNLGLTPDIVSSAKGLGGGFPIGAMLSSEKLARVLVPGTHGNTFGGNALACRAASEVLKILEKEQAGSRVEKLLPIIEERFQRLTKQFSHIVSGYRGMGLLQGLTLFESTLAQDLVKKCLSQGVVWGGAGMHVLRFAPSLLISESSLCEAFDATERALS